MNDASETTTAELTAEARPFGWMLAVGAVLTLAFAFIHPQITSRELAGVLREIAAGAAFNGAVHGTLLALSMVLVAGFYGLSRRLGLGRPAVALGMTFYAAGAMAFTGAAVINGFAFATFAGRYGNVAPDQVAAVSAAFNLAGSIAATWAILGAVATSAAIAAWSLALAGKGGAERIIGGLGILLGLATIALVVTGTLMLDVHGFLLLVASQTLWTLAVGVRMIQGRV